MKPANLMSITEYNRAFKEEMVIEWRTYQQEMNAVQKKQLLNNHQEMLIAHIAWMHQFISNCTFIEQPIPSDLLLCFDWACYQSIDAFKLPSERNTQNLYVDLSIKTAHTANDPKYIAEAWVNKCIQAISNKEPYLLRDAVKALGLAIENVDISDRNHFELYLKRHIASELYKKEDDIECLMQNVESSLCIGGISKPQTTLYDKACQKAKEDAALNYSLNQLMDAFEHKCTLLSNAKAPTPI